MTRVTGDGMTFSGYLKQLCAGTGAARELSEEDAWRLFGTMLDGGVSELELGALLVALRLKTESLSELTGFYGALAARMFRLQCSIERVLPVVLPSYGGARNRPNLLPLLAMLLQRFGVPVLVHGMLNGGGGVASAYIFRELGIMPSANLTQAQVALDRGGIAFVPTALLAPGLAELISLRDRLGVRNSAHVMAKLLDPFESGSVRVIAAGAPDRLSRLREFLQTAGARALLLRSTEGEPVADPGKRPRIELLVEGRCEVLFEAEAGSSRSAATLPAAVDAQTTGAWIRQALGGEAPLPLPVVNQLACCLFASGYTQDMAQAKAIVAVETGSLAAA